MFGKNHIKWWSVALMLIAMALPFAIRGSASKKEGITQANRVKATYVLMEAQRQHFLEHDDAFYHLIAYAYSLDSTNTSIAFYMGVAKFERTSFEHTDELTAALAQMRKHVEAHPEDKYEARLYAHAAFLVNQYQEGLRVLNIQHQLHPQDDNLLSTMADAYEKTSDYKKALAIYDTLQQWQGQSVELSSAKLKAYQALNDTTGAIHEMRALLASAPTNADYNLAMGKMLFMFGYRDSAMVYYDKAQQYEPDNGLTYLTKAEYYLALGDTLNYDRQTYQALVSTDLDVESKLQILVNYTKTLLSAKDTTHRTDHLFDVLIEQHPLEPQIRVLYSEYLMFIDNNEGAAEQIDYALNLDPTNEELWTRLMAYYLYAGNYEKAIEVGDKAIRLNPDNVELYSYLGSSCYSVKQYDKAIEVYDKALAILDSTQVDDRSNLLSGKADVKFAMGDTIAAFALYDQSLDLNPDNPGTLNNYAYFLALSNRDLDKAERMSAKTIVEDAANPTYLDTYAWVFYMRKEYTMAQLYIEMAINNEEQPTSELFEHYGYILLANGDKQKALEQWRKAIELKPDNEQLVKQIEKISNENGNENEN
ncbi:MAG: tetratricopeptide repeat protein [Muribaculaceae bacterium]|nr:tetratricopeptide repeat protein [Muribaculaceae bacterium]